MKNPDRMKEYNRSGLVACATGIVLLTLLASFDWRIAIAAVLIDLHRTAIRRMEELNP